MLLHVMDGAPVPEGVMQYRCFNSVLHNKTKLPEISIRPVFFIDTIPRVSVQRPAAHVGRVLLPAYSLCDRRYSAIVWFVVAAVICPGCTVNWLADVYS